MAPIESPTIRTINPLHTAFRLRNTHTPASATIPGNAHAKVIPVLASLNGRRDCDVVVVLLVEIVSTELPVEERLPKLHEEFAGKPLQLNVTAVELKLESVSVVVAVPPGVATVSVEGLAPMAGAITNRFAGAKSKAS